MSGSKVKMWKQDPSVRGLGIRTAYVPSEVNDGPKDDDIVIMGMPAVFPNSNGNFLFDPVENPLEFDAVHTYAVVRRVLSIYRRALKRNGIDDDFRWQWEDGPIRVYPRAGLEANAYYSRQERSLKFFYFHPNNPSSEMVYSCRSFDIVAHEAGHAILDALRPGYWSSWRAQTGGLHESFGDLTTIFAMLGQLDVCNAIVAESKGDLHAKTFFPAVAEQFGQAFGRIGGLRNADNNLKLSQVGTQVHELSSVFTGAVYDILADIFDEYKKPESYDLSETLFRVGKHVTALVILALVKGPEKNATYSDIAKKMIELEPVERWKPLIEKHFAIREVLGPKAFRIEGEDDDVSRLNLSCCHSLANMESLLRPKDPS